jgi:hypothetical protein
VYERLIQLAQLSQTIRQTVVREGKIGRQTDSLVKLRRP